MYSPRLAGQSTITASPKASAAYTKPSSSTGKDPWRGADDLEIATLGWVDWFNHTRFRSSLGYQTPAKIEAAYDRHTHADDQPLPAELIV